MLHQNMELIWHKQVPLKVSIFVWCLLRDRLPTKQNLASRGVLYVEARSCIDRCGHVEDLNHLFLSCPYFAALWPMVRAWLGVVGGETQFITDQQTPFSCHGHHRAMGGSNAM